MKDSERGEHSYNERLRKGEPSYLEAAARRNRRTTSNVKGEQSYNEGLGKGGPSYAPSALVKQTSMANIRSTQAQSAYDNQVCKS